MGVRTDSDSSVGDVECDSEEEARAKYDDTLVEEDDVVDVITECEDDVDRARSRVVDEAPREAVDDLVLPTLAVRMTLRSVRLRVLDWPDEVEGVVRSWLDEGLGVSASDGDSGMSDNLRFRDWTGRAKDDVESLVEVRDPLDGCGGGGGGGGG